MQGRRALGLIGPGRWGELLYKSFSKLVRVPVCLGSGSERCRAKILLLNPPCAMAADLSELLNNPTLSGVIIASPPPTHFEYAVQALRAGKHVFLEKPGAENESQAEQLVEVARRQNLVLIIGYKFLYDPVFEALQKRLRDLAPAPSCRATFRWHKYGSFQNDIVGNLLVHDLALATRLFGAIKTHEIIHCDGRLQDCNQLTVRVEFCSGAQANFEIDRKASTPKKSLEVVADGRKLQWIENSLQEVDLSSNLCTRLPVTQQSAVDNEAKTFLSLIDENKKTNPSLDVFVEVSRWHQLLKAELA